MTRKTLHPWEIKKICEMTIRIIALSDDPAWVNAQTLKIRENAVVILKMLNEEQ